jgi:glycosyltransferase involved in cell wall biosynthesis
MRFLALTTRHIESRQSGYDLRVANLCAHLPGEVHLVVAPFRPPGEARPGLPLEGVFDSVEELAPLRAEPAHPRRHLRLSNVRFLQLSRPRAFAAARERLLQVIREREITHVLVFGGEIAELAAGLDSPDRPRVLLDICDSTALTAHRARCSGQVRPTTLVRQVKECLDVARKRRTESSLVASFDLVTTISDPDSRAVEGRRSPGAVVTVPNGLDEAYVRPLPPAGRRRGVVFWGNLAFAPNRDALRFFVDQVFLPRLRHRGVELCVVGADAPSWLVDLAAEEPAIRLTGYVEDLPAIVTDYPIMINPMRTGSGLKNKVLEAFGLGLAVVSTSLGVEALPQARDGEHLTCAEGDDEFAAGVLSLLEDDARRERLRTAAHRLVRQHYRWDAVGRDWRRVVVGPDVPTVPTVPHRPGDHVPPRSRSLVLD